MGTRAGEQSRAVENGSAAAARNQGTNMEDAETFTPYPLRELFARVRAGLDAAGRQDIAFDLQWVNDERQGYPFTIDVPVGAEFVVPLKPLESMLTETDGMGRFANALIRAMINIRRAEKVLVRYAEAIRGAAKREIAAAREAGLDLLLEKVNFKPTYAWHLTQRDWKNAASYILAQVDVRSTSFYLRPEITSVIVEEPEHMERELASVFEEHREYQGTLEAMRSRGADLIVDAITIDLLRVHGFDVAETLRRVWKRQCVNLPNAGDDDRIGLSIISSKGRVSSSISLGDAYWNGEQLWFHQAVDAEELRQAIGKCLPALSSHPSFAALKVARVEQSGDRPPLIYFQAPGPDLLFDASTGRMWPDPEPASTGERIAA
jgi:hypothetical protein